MSAKLINAEMLPDLVGQVGDVILDKIHDKSYYLAETVAVPSLKEAVQERIYDAYTPVKYERNLNDTSNLLHIIEPFSDKFSPISARKRRKKSVKFGAFFGEEGMLYTTLLGSNKYAKGDFVTEVPLWANEGWSWTTETFKSKKGFPKPQRNPKPDFIKYSCEKIRDTDLLQEQISLIFR